MGEKAARSSGPFRPSEPHDRPQPTPQRRITKGEREEILCDLQREAVAGPDAPPHPLHVAEEHDDTEEGEVAGDADEGAGHREVVQQVPEAGRGQRLLESTSLPTSQKSFLGEVHGSFPFKTARRGAAAEAPHLSPVKWAWTRR